MNSFNSNNTNNNSNNNNNNKRVVNCEITKKDRYLSRLINQMVKDPELNVIFNNPELSELEKDRKVLTILINSEKFHFEITQEEILGSFIESKVRSGKSRFIADRNVEKALDFINEDKFAEASNAYSKAIVKQPFNTKEECYRLAEIYLDRARVFAKLGDEEAYAIDLHFALAADNDIKSQLNEEEGYLVEQYKNSIPQSCSGSDDDIFYLNPSFSIIINGDNDDLNNNINNNNNNINNDEIKLVPRIQMPEDSTVIRERPLSKYNCTTFDNCACCDRYIRDFLYWPCKKCSDIVFCSVDCFNKEYEHHAFECGLTNYMKQIPIYLLMIRYYSRTFTNPLTTYFDELDYIKSFLSHIKDPNRYPMERNSYLNVFRQYMDRHKKRKEFLTKNSKNYYAVLIMAVEFLYLFDACVFNEKFTEEQPYTEAHLRSPITTMLPDVGQFSWSLKPKPLSRDDIVDLVIYCFQDLKRFIASPFSKFELLPSNYRENYRKERKILLLTGLLFPEQHSMLANIVPTFNRNTGLIEIKTSRTINANDRLILNRNMRVIPMAPL